MQPRVFRVPLVTGLAALAQRRPVFCVLLEQFAPREAAGRPPYTCSIATIIAGRALIRETNGYLFGALRLAWERGV